MLVIIDKGDNDFAEKTKSDSNEANYDPQTDC